MVSGQNDVTLNVSATPVYTNIVLDKAYNTIKITFKESFQGSPINLKIIDTLSWISCTASSSPNGIVSVPQGNNFTDGGFNYWSLNGDASVNVNDFVIINIKNAHFPINTNIEFSIL